MPEYLIKIRQFESSVNSEGIETLTRLSSRRDLFESSVNSEGIETKYCHKLRGKSLRAV